ncbi:MAG: phosphodiesterase, partial [Anaerolineae bacterium]|nr:phosphodiesterase [Anaerolineae bacterium]
IIILWGEKVKRGETIEGARIIDLAPTILYLMGLPIPVDMDGRALTEALKPEFVSQNPPLFSDLGSDRESGRDVYSPQEEEEVRERLKGFGYVA